MTELRVWRAHDRDSETAFQLVREYNEAASRKSISVRAPDCGWRRWADRWRGALP
jgi:hypothetical protein